MSKRILILSNHFITLYNFRKELIIKLVNEGNKVFISMPEDDQNDFFKNMGCEIMETSINRRGINPIQDIKLIIDYLKIIKQVKPDIIFSYTIKPNIYGSIASNILSHKQISNITGTGSTFLHKNFLSEIAKILYKISLKRSYKVFFQNSGDKNFFLENKMINDNFEMLPGSGVNLNQYTISPLPNDDSVSFIFIGRIMHLKGIDQYLDAARIIKEKFPNTNFYVAGFIEEEKYRKIIEKDHLMGTITYLGFRKNIIEWIEKCHCTILPSLGGEGVPNVLLETAAIGRICIASNISGSKDVIEDNVTGYLFEPGNTKELISKIINYLNLEKEDKQKMGILGRNKIEVEYDREIVINKYLKELTVNKNTKEKFYKEISE